MNPETGRVHGTLWAGIPAGAEAQRIRFRFFAGIPSFGARPELGPATVNGAPREVRRSHSIAAISLPADHAGRVRVKLPFAYTLRPAGDSGGLLSAAGGDMSPEDIGLLSRHDNAVNLGHWLPLWIPQGRSHDPKPDGFGDIGNFPSARFSLDITVPSGWTVITGGSRVSERTRDGQRTVRAEGFGLRSLVVNVVRGYTSKERTVGDTTVTVYAPRDDRRELTPVLETATDSLRVLEDAFGSYPWRQLDVIAAPLGAGIGGMEWSGAVWIESGIFAGQLPGLGALGELEGLESLEELDVLNGPGALGDPGGQDAPFKGLLGQVGKTMDSTRSWTVAHEIGHQWWHILAGNDSVQAPAVDEPLAQYSACLVLRRTREGSAEELCGSHMGIGYSQLRLTGGADAPALQRTDEFASPMQYSGVIYGKAPHMYLSLEARYGREAVVAALREVARVHAFEYLSPAELRHTLATSLEDPSGVREIWSHWLEETHGDADLGAGPGSGGKGGAVLNDLLGELGDDSGGHSGGPGVGNISKLLGHLLDDLQDSGGGSPSDGLGDVFDEVPGDN